MLVDDLSSRACFVPWTLAILIDQLGERAAEDTAFFKPFAQRGLVVLLRAAQLRPERERQGAERDEEQDERQHESSQPGAEFRFWHGAIHGGDLPLSALARPA